METGADYRKTEELLSRLYMFGSSENVFLWVLMNCIHSIIQISRFCNSELEKQHFTQQSEAG